jgi:phosphatidylglycerol:prolipoprotein diacylglycerol transferase
VYKRQAKNPFVYIYQHKTVVGGFLGGLFGVELVKKIIGEDHASGDLFTYPMILALAIGRIGCFSMGIYEETYGVPTSSFTGMKLGDAIDRHPVSLYEIGFLLLCWLCIVQLEKRHSLTDGGRFKIFMMAYLSFRFLLDLIKPHYTFSFGLSPMQLACLLGLIYYSPFIFRPKKLILSAHA